MAEAPLLASQCLVLAALIFLGAWWMSHRHATKDRRLRRHAKAMDATVQFLRDMNELPLGMPISDLQTHLWNRLQPVLRPLRIHSRLWIVDQGWKTLQGVGELPGEKPPTHLPMSACPALCHRRPFAYSAARRPAACSSEQFNFAKHLCIPLMDGRDSFGVLFLASSSADEWESEDEHLFHVLSQAMALSLQRRLMFDKLQEKISELHFSFEVGASALTAFDGSTQSLEGATQHILDAVLTVLKVDRVTYMEWDAEQGILRTTQMRGQATPLPSPLMLGRGEGLAGWALQIGQPYSAEYAMGDPHFVPGGNSMTSLLCVPVFSMNREPLGVINAATLGQPRRFTPREIQFVSNFSRLAGLALENARLHHSSRANIHHLNEVNQLKSDFLSLVSHDLRGPLTGVRGLAEVLKLQTLGPLNSVQLDLLDQLETQVELQERMVDDLLDLARMEKGKLSIYPREADLISVLREEVQKGQRAARDRNIELVLHTEDDARLHRLPMDPGRIRQVLWNLIHNALKFTPEGGHVEVSAECGDGNAYVEVRDTGAGLASDMLDRVFDKFFQVTPGGSKGSQGLGLGLAICREIVQSHGGRIRAFSDGPGQGTRMRFTLPLEITASLSESREQAA